MTADEQIRRGSRHARPVEDLTTKARSKAGQVSNPYPVLSVFPPPPGVPKVSASSSSTTCQISGKEKRAKLGESAVGSLLQRAYIPQPK